MLHPTQAFSFLCYSQSQVDADAVRLKVGQALRAAAVLYLLGALAGAMAVLEVCHVLFIDNGIGLRRFLAVSA
jgi:hypothetical protein